jgi:hypothetical protein
MILHLGEYPGNAFNCIRDRIDTLFDFTSNVTDRITKFGNDGRQCPGDGGDTVARVQERLDEVADSVLVIPATTVSIEVRMVLNTLKKTAPISLMKSTNEVMASLAVLVMSRNNPGSPFTPMMALLMSTMDLLMIVSIPSFAGVTPCASSQQFQQTSLVTHL